MILSLSSGFLDKARNIRKINDSSKLKLLCLKGYCQESEMTAHRVEGNICKSYSGKEACILLLLGNAANAE